MRAAWMLFLCFPLLLLQACADVATTGAQVVYNRHSLQKSVNDQLTTMHAYQALYHKTNQFKNANITIATYNNEILLAGQAPQAWQRAEAERIIKSTLPDVSRVYNLVTVASPSSTLTRMSDAWITTKVKARMLASNDIDATQIKVVTENGTVYLMGILKPDHAEKAVELTRTIDGVVGVVKIFSYMHITRKPDRQIHA